MFCNHPQRFDRCSFNYALLRELSQMKWNRKTLYLSNNAENEIKSGESAGCEELLPAFDINSKVMHQIESDYISL